MSDKTPSPQAPPKLSVEPERALGEYANFVSIAHNFSEVLLDFGRTMPGRNDIPVVARLVMNPFHAKQLLRALNHNLQLYEKTYGAIADPPAGPTTEPPEGGAN